MVNLDKLGTVSQLQTELLAKIDRGEVTSVELERFRRELPADEQSAELLTNGMLEWPLSELFEYVEGSDRQSSYWRTRPPRRLGPGGQSAAQEQFGEIQESVEGETGTRDLDGKEVPPGAKAAAEEATGATGEAISDDPAAADSGHKAVDRLRALLGSSEDSDGTEREETVEGIRHER
jgi:hypothetical protein